FRFEPAAYRDGRPVPGSVRVKRWLTPSAPPANWVQVEPSKAARLWAATPKTESKHPKRMSRGAGPPGSTVMTWEEKAGQAGAAQLAPQSAASRTEAPAASKREKEVEEV